ncbi:hypothetical protein NFI96_030183, partial [Prochilodus magdalenae]
VGRLLIRKLVSEKLCLPWDGFRLGRTSRGKPYLAEPSPGPGTVHWSFNVSHQGDYAVLAAAPGRQVGVDVMKTSRPGSSSVPEFFRIMTRQFTELEWRTIRSAGSDWDQLHMFYRHWALKESFIKAIGSGLGFDLQRVEFHISPNQLQEGRVFCQTRMYLDEEEEDTWTFEECLLDKHHHVAVALGKPEGPAFNVSPANADYRRARCYFRNFKTTNSTQFTRDLFKPPSSRFTQEAVILPEATPPAFTLLSFSELVSGATPLSDEDPSYWESFQSKQEAPVRQSEMQ